MTRSGLLACIAAAGLTGCVTGPNNGDTAGGAVVGQGFSYSGYTNTPNELITLEVMAQPQLDPGLPSSWVAFGTTTTSSSPTYINDTAPLYAWSAWAAPVPTWAQAARWTPGGVVRTRVKRANGGILDTFDAPTFFNCVVTHYGAGESWQTIGPACSGLSTKSTSRTSGTVGIASTVPTPLDLAGTDKPDWLGYKGDTYQDPTDPTRDEAAAYYRAWGAPTTLASFQSTYGFGSGDVSATFYNNGDLGLGREMHCQSSVLPLGLGNTVACYVTNYSGVDNVATFDQPPDAVLNDAVHHQHAFATVAMVYSRVAGIGLVNFVVYDKNGALSTRAKLDSVGRHTSVPNVCLECHGISSYYNPGSHAVADSAPVAGQPAARFLAFDPFSYLYSTVPGFTQADQMDKFRRLNAMVKQTQPAAATLDLIAGMYAPNVDDPTAVASDEYVPAGWASMDSSQDGNALYLGVIKHGCRMCHASASNPSLDFLQGSDWSDKLARVRALVCNKTTHNPDGSVVLRGHAMPQAEHVSKQLWATGGRALVLSYTQGTATFPDTNASCDP
jgi:hypothetical protein